MARKSKLKLVVDEDLVDPIFLESIDSLKNVRIKAVDAKGISDKDIFIQANKDNYHILTNNFRDFLRLFRRNQTLRVGVIGINTKLSLRVITPKVVNLLNILGNEDVYHKFYEVTNDGCRIHHRRSAKKDFVSWRNIENVLSN